MSEDFIMCARAVKNNKFISEPGKSLYLLCLHKTQPFRCRNTKRMQANGSRIYASPPYGDRQRATLTRIRQKDRGDILVFIHGYNNS